MEYEGHVTISGLGGNVTGMLRCLDDVPACRASRFDFRLACSGSELVLCCFRLRFIHVHDKKRIRFSQGPQATVGQEQRYTSRAIELVGLASSATRSWPQTSDRYLWRTCLRSDRVMMSNTGLPGSLKGAKDGK